MPMVRPDFAAKAYEFYPQTNIPGYAGYIPRRIFDCGATFGRAASPTIRANCVQNHRERHYRKGPAFMMGTKAFHEAESARPTTAEQEVLDLELRSQRGAPKDGTIAVPRYYSTFEKPGYSGHIPMHLDDNPNTEAAIGIQRDIPGYSGHVRGTMNKTGISFGRVARARAVATPENIALSRQLYSAHGGFKHGPRPLTGSAGAPFATDHNSGLNMMERLGTGDPAQRPETGDPTRPRTGMTEL